MIRELRILPPLAIARLGAAPTPMDNYDVEVDPERPLGPRTLRPAETLEVDEATGAIGRTFVPDALRFTENGAARPVAPFLEVWALTDTDTLEPLTTALLAAEGADADDVRWRVEVANLKAARRTRAAADRVSADTGEFSDHDRHPLTGRCPNFVAGASIPFGHVRYVRPTDAHPGIRLRFSPAAGLVYGARTTPPSPPDPNVVAAVYDAGPGRGTWRGYIERDANRVTAPAFIYAQDANGVSLGYLDDACDGVVRVTVTLDGSDLSAFGRIASGPPTYAPDAYPVRTVADELEQALLGPDVDPAEVTVERVEEIIRRAFETVRLMNTDAMNRVGNTMAGQDAGAGRLQEPIMAPSLVDTTALENLHQSLLLALRGGSAPWFADVLRKFDEVGDLSDRGRRKMPAMMRGADGRHLALTRRQVDLIRALVRGPVFPPDTDRETP